MAQNDPRFQEDERFEPDPTPQVSAGPSFAEQVYISVFNAHEFIMKPARQFADYMSRPGLETSVPSAMVQGFLGGATEGAASQLSPANIIGMGKGKLPQIANQILSGAQVLHGGSELAQGNIAEGLGDIGFGALGVKTSRAKSPHLPESTTKITAESMPEGFFHKEPTLGTPKTGGLDDARIVKPEVPKLTKLGEKPSELPTQNLEAGVDYVDPYEGYR